MEVQIHSFLTCMLDGEKWSASRSGRFTPQGESPLLSVSPTTGLDAIEHTEGTYVLSLSGKEQPFFGSTGR
jgi:hypothetical protein